MSAARNPLILAVNPGTTSTKIALFRGSEETGRRDVSHPDSLLDDYADRPVLDQLPWRLAAVRDALGEAGVEERALAAAVGRGGLLRPVEGGTYGVDEAMLADLREASRGEHASNLGAFLAAELTASGGGRAFVVDPVSVDEWDDVARLSGLEGLDRECLSHALNTKAVARRHARETGRRYQDLRLVVAHLGTGISVSAHRNGRMVDVNNSREEGPFAMDRAGSLPVLLLVGKVLDEGWSRDEAVRRIFREGGVHSYLGTRSLREVLNRIGGRDAKAERVFQAMLYQVRKEVGAMAAVLEGRVDAVLLTGGMAHAPEVAGELEAALRWIAPVHVHPGEDELQALAEGALAVLRGDEQARRYGSRPGSGTHAAR